MHLIKDNIICYGIIYKILNIKNGKVYIGQTIKQKGFNGRYDYSGVGAERVYKYYSVRFKSGKGVNEHLYNSLNKYGIENFVVDEVFDVAFNKEELDFKEKYWIKYYNATDSDYGYNITDGGSNGKINKEARLKSSLSRIGKNTRSDNPNSKKVICLTTNKIFDCLLDAAEYYNINRKSISQSCSNKRKSGGKLSDGTPLVWMYYDEYLNNPEIVAMKSKKSYTEPNKKHRMVKCVTTGEVFYSITDAVNFYGLKSMGNIISCCKGKLDYSGTLPDGTKLVWKYI